MKNRKKIIALLSLTFFLSAGAGMDVVMDQDTLSLTPKMVSAAPAKSGIKNRDTVADLVADTELTVGERVRTRGFHTDQDGLGTTYIIRDREHVLPVEVKDSIPLDNGLFAVVDKKTAGFDSQQGSSLGVFFTSNEDTVAEFYYSDENKVMKHLLRSGTQTGRDPSLQYYNHAFYLCYVTPEESGTTFRISRSYDLQKWEDLPGSPYTVITREKNQNLWAPDLFIDEDGKAYVYFAKSHSAEDPGTMDLYVSSSAANINDGDFGQATLMQMPARSNSYIDAQVRKINGSYYMLAKNEKIYTDNNNKSPLLLKSSSPAGGFQEVTTWPLKAIRGYEGFTFFAANGNIYVYGDNYSGWYDLPPQSKHTVWFADLENMETGPYAAEYVESSGTLRHGTVIPVDNDYMRRVLTNITQGKPVKDSVQKDRQSSTVSLSQFFDSEAAGNGTAEIAYFAPAPRVIYEVPKGKNVVIKSCINAYGVEKMSFKFADPSSGSLAIEYADPANPSEKKQLEITSDKEIHDFEETSFDIQGNNWVVSTRR